MFICNMFSLERLKNQADSLQDVFKNCTRFNVKGGGGGEELAD